MNLHRPIRLRTRVTASFVLLLALWGIVLSIALGAILSESARRFHRDQGFLLVRGLAAEAAPLAYYEDLAGIAGLVAQELKSNPNARYAVVMDATNRPIWSTFPGGVPADLLALRHDYAPGSDSSVLLIRSGGERMYDYEARKGDVVVRLGVSLAPVEALIRRIVAFTAVIGMVGLLAVLWTAWKVSRPVEILSRAVERAVSLDRRTGGEGLLNGTLETSVIGQRFGELMGRLDERTRQLDAARKLAYLGEVSATIAHEINNPLGVLAMNSGFLDARAKAGEFNPGAAEEVRRLRTASRRATLATQKLLQFARYTMKSDGLRPKPVKVPGMISECLDLLEDRFHLAGCRARTELPPDLPEVIMDEQGIQQVVFNLITNALDASREGGEIVVRAGVESGRLVLSVSDEGQGMSEEAIRRAAEPFYSTKEHGLGLGLAISNSIVQAHGGTLDLRSQPGKGTTAEARIPVLSSSEAES